jgi:hypothetical protein
MVLIIKALLNAALRVDSSLITLRFPLLESFVRHYDMGYLALLRPSEGQPMDTRVKAEDVGFMPRGTHVKDKRERDS